MPSISRASPKPETRILLVSFMVLLVDLIEQRLVILERKDRLILGLECNLREMERSINALHTTVRMLRGFCILCLRRRRIVDYSSLESIPFIHSRNCKIPTTITIVGSLVWCGPALTESNSRRMQNQLCRYTKRMSGQKGDCWFRSFCVSLANEAS